jgi:DNA primase
VSVIDEVKERLDIVDVISSYVALKKAGHNYKALCPFHSEKTPSFVVFPDTQTWKCFGCGAGGDLFSFVMRQENVEFGEALRSLAARAGVSLAPRDEGAASETRLRDRLRKLNALAADYFHHLLLHSPEGAKARSYLDKRGILDETRKRFQLGCARDDWQALGDHLTKKGYSWQDLLQAGLVVERQGGGYYDRFRHRLIFPIRNRAGYVVGFGARALDDSLPKYLNSPQTAIFDKSGVLYGIDQAKRAIREQGCAVIVEGYMDVLMAHQHGRNNVVASMGTALTEKQIRVIKKLTKRLVLALDADTAGDQATLRGLELARETFDHRAVPVPTWRGLIHYEDQLDAEIRIVTLPDDLDPDEVIKADVDRWDALIDQALPVIEYYLQGVISKFDLHSPKEKAAAAREVLPLIREIRSAVERSHYLQRLARMLRVDVQALEQELHSKEAVKRGSLTVAERSGRLSAQPGLTFGLERYILMLLIKQPELLTSMNAVLDNLGLEPLAAEDFTRIEERALFNPLSAHIEQHETIDLDTLLQELEGVLREQLDSILTVMESVAFLSDEQAELDAHRCALDLRELRLRRELEELSYLQADARAQNDSETAKQWGRMVNGLAMQLVRLQKEKALQTSLRSSPRITMGSMGAGDDHGR